MSDQSFAETYIFSMLVAPLKVLVFMTSILLLSKKLKKGHNKED